MPYPELAAEARDMIRTAFATLNRAPGYVRSFELAQRSLAAAYRDLADDAEAVPIDGIDGPPEPIGGWCCGSPEH